MNGIAARHVLAGAMLVTSALSVALIWQGAVAVGIALLVLAIAVSGPLFGRSGERLRKDAD
jgi:hypothetical protein